MCLRGGERDEKWAEKLRGRGRTVEGQWQSRSADQPHQRAVHVCCSQKFHLLFVSGFDPIRFQKMGSKSFVMTFLSTLCNLRCRVDTCLKVEGVNM